MKEINCRDEEFFISATFKFKLKRRLRLSLYLFFKIKESCRLPLLISDALSVSVPLVAERIIQFFVWQRRSAGPYSVLLQFPGSMQWHVLR